MLDAVMEVYIKASATSLANLLSFESVGDSGMEDGGLSQESGDTWMLHASTLPLLLDTSTEVVISDPYRMMTSAKQPDMLDFRDRNIYSGARSEERTKGKDVVDRQEKRKFRQKGFLRRRKSKKRISSFSPSFSSPPKILPSSSPVKQKKMIALLSSQEVAFNQLLLDTYM